MSFFKQVNINNIDYHYQEHVIFKNLNLSLGLSKFGLVGKNGVGKSTLLKLIANEIIPTLGTIQVSGTVFYSKQEIQDGNQDTIAQFLGIESKLAAFKRITAGSTDVGDYEILGNDWDIEGEAYRHLNQFGLSQIKLEQPLSNLSGGQKNLLTLALAFFSNVDFILLDEPTNNLDIENRERLYHKIEEWRQGLIIASHDRTLLNLMDNIIELSALGLKLYGGNYQFYMEQKAIEVQAAQQALESSKKILKKAESNIQGRKERHEKAQAKGKKAKEKQIQAKGRNSDFKSSESKERSENTQRRLNIQGDRKLDWIKTDLALLKSKVFIEKKMSLNLPKTKVGLGKKILLIKDLVFGYHSEKPIIDHFDIESFGPQRIAFCGQNGSGKTTLLKLIADQVAPWSGVIEKIEQFAYLDQFVNFLNPDLSILENFTRLNPDITELDARYHLANFLFRGNTSLKKVAVLSSGEKLRAALACLLMANQPPQLLILDEPTNYLDLNSIRNVEEALLNYQGAIFLVSHDIVFMKNIGIEKVWCAPFNENCQPITTECYFEKLEKEFNHDANQQCS